MKRLIGAVLVAAAIHGLFWHLAHESVDPTDVAGPIQHLSYSPYHTRVNPKDVDTIPAEKIERDLERVAAVARGVRTYSVTAGVDQVPEIAADLGLDVTLGAWIGDTESRDRAEVEAVVDLSRANRNIRSILVGNEVLLREERTVDELIALIREVKRQVYVPVSTSEIWYLWLQHPELVSAVDYISVHILPYWEGIGAEEAVSYTMARLEELRAAYPGKKIVISEFGWPSRGYNNLAAKPGELTQASVIREFIDAAEKHGVAYNIIEAFDQPWKSNEGSVGAYWGLFDSSGEPKFALSGPVEESGMVWKMSLALIVGAGLTILGLVRGRATVGHALAYAAAANAVAAAVAIAAAYPVENYLNPGLVIMWVVGFVLIVPLTLISLTKLNEIFEVSLGHRPKRLINVMGASPLTRRMPKISIHIPAYREPPHMLIQTLDSVAALKYPNFEVVVIVNNTPEAEYSAPVAAHCQRLGARFKFLDIVVKGFKAGALNAALEHTAPDAEIIAVIDADYAVLPNWLSDLSTLFEDPRVALVQAPQDHRDGHESLFKTLMNSEYAGFFDVGMVQRNEDNAIVQHGTMCMVRRSALMEVGGWGSDTIVEDTELGLRLMEAGYLAHYTNNRYGYGLLPDTFEAFKTQRFRWAYGGMQIIRKHWAHMLPGSRSLTGAQKSRFVVGWMYWLADALGTGAAILNLIWVPVILFVGVVIPPLPLTIPVVAAFLIALVHCAVLYAKRVHIPFYAIPGAALSAMSLQFTVARAVLSGLVTDTLPFKRTDKGGNTKKRVKNPVAWETALGTLLAASALVLVLTNDKHVTELTIFAMTLAIQSVPFLAARLMLAIERGWKGHKVDAPNALPVPLEMDLEKSAMDSRPDAVRAA